MAKRRRTKRKNIGGGLAILVNPGRKRRVRRRKAKARRKSRRKVFHLKGVAPMARKRRRKARRARRANPHRRRHARRRRRKNVFITNPRRGKARRSRRRHRNPGAGRGLLKGFVGSLKEHVPGAALAAAADIWGADKVLAMLPASISSVVPRGVFKVVGYALAGQLLKKVPKVGRFADSFACGGIAIGLKEAIQSFAAGAGSAPTAGMGMFSTSYDAVGQLGAGAGVGYSDWIGDDMGAFMER